MTEPWLWTSSDLARGVSLLAQGADLGQKGNEVSAPTLSRPTASEEVEVFERWLQNQAQPRGLEVQSILGYYGPLAETLSRAGPALIRLPDEGQVESAGRLPISGPWILLLGIEKKPWPGAKTWLKLIARDGQAHRVAVDQLVARLRQEVDWQHRDHADQLLDRAGVPEGRRARAMEALLAQRFADRPIFLGYLLRDAPGSDVGGRLRRLGTFKNLAGLSLLHAAQYVLWLVSWVLIGRAALSGALAASWALAWVLLLLTLIPLRMTASWLMGRMSIDLAAELKSRLLQGALKVDRDSIRAEGAGQALGRVIEAEAVESLAMAGGLTTLTAMIELPFALWVLSQGASSLWLPALGAGLLMLSALWTVGLQRAMSRWTDQRLAMTHRLVEKMVGHSTRLVQEAGDPSAEQEDQELSSYLQDLSVMDQRWVRLLMVPRAWLPLALLALTPGFAVGGAAGSAMAVAVGGVLLFQGVLMSLTAGLMTLATAWISGSRVRPLFEAAAKTPADGLPQLDLAAEAPAADTPTADTPVAITPAARAPEPTPLPGESTESSEPVGQRPAPVLMRAGSLSFEYPGRGRPVLEDCNVEVHRGDRILLQGPSGGGKSTLASLLAGLRRPSAGSLQLHGLDRGSLGLSAWRRRVLMVPQFHDNHVLTETFAFNLLLGRPWPPSGQDMRRAQEICQELGLGDLLQRMPSGVHQMVGETGWKLSHGERGRLFLARALLQDADLLLLDESFAALDPDNLKLAMACARRRAKTLIVIAHP